MKKGIVLIGIVFFGLFLRLYGLDWDQGFHLHPDERFLTMVSVDTTLPNSLREYFDAKTSTLNPVNRGHTFYVYGLLPITLNKYIGTLLLNTTYNTIHLQGRVLSAVFDVLVVILVFKIVELLEQRYRLHKNVKYISAFLYSIAVLPIQLSHYFAVDTFLNTFGWLGIYMATRLYVHPKIHPWKHIVLAALFLGCSIASKVSGIYFVPLVGIILAASLLRGKYSARFVFSAILLFVSTGYVALRVGSPYYFESSHVLNPQISKKFIDSLLLLKSFEKPGFFPPATQWIHAPWYLSVLNLSVFGLGMIYSIFVLIGSFKMLISRKRFIFMLLLVWALSILVYQSLQFAKTMRYLIFIYPVCAIVAGQGVAWLLERKVINRRLKSLVMGIVFVALLVWPLAFMSIYTKKHSRVEASYWIYKNIPHNSRIAWEYWDDPLPLLVEDSSRIQYQGVQINIFEPDTPEKWNNIQHQLNKTDYYVMSSNRGWGSIPTVPEMYPLGVDFYKDMFRNKRGFTKIKEFVSYPSLRYLGIPIDFPDQWAEEAFTVYDHPKVMIFKKNI